MDKKYKKMFKIFREELSKENINHANNMDKIYERHLIRIEKYLKSDD